jgi:hypothetical protein
MSYRVEMRFSVVLRWLSLAASAAAVPLSTVLGQNAMLSTLNSKSKSSQPKL